MAQGEDVVAGTHTPRPLEEMTSWNAKALNELIYVAKTLEVAKREVQDIEFTIENGKVFILQTRTAKRTAVAAVKIAVDMWKEEKINSDEVFARVSRRQYHLSQKNVVKTSTKADHVGKPACSGAAVGLAVSPADAINCKVPYILVGEETTPDDIAVMDKAVGVLTMKGGATSHAAVVARSMDKPCVVGLGVFSGYFHGKQITIDGATGKVWIGAKPVVSGAAGSIKDFDKILMEGVVPVNEPGDVSLLDVSDLIAVNRIKDAIDKIVEYSKVGKVMVRWQPDGKTKNERHFFAMFGVKTSAVQTFLGEWANLADQAVNEVIFFVAPGVNVPPGVKTMSATDSIEQVLMAEGPMFWNGLVEQGILKLAKLMAHTGQKVMVPGVLHEGMTPVLSKSQAISLRLK